MRGIDDAVGNTALGRAVQAVMDDYFDAFSAGDISRINRLVSYPLLHVGRDGVTFHDRFPIDPAELARCTGWAFSRYQTRVVAVCETKAHVVGSGTRHRADGTVIERVDAFYVFMFRDGAWKMTVISDVLAPPGPRDQD